jgi:hypothetical protein
MLVPKLRLDLFYLTYAQQATILAQPVREKEGMNLPELFRNIPNLVAKLRLGTT